MTSTSLYSFAHTDNNLVRSQPTMNDSLFSKERMETDFMVLYAAKPALDEDAVEDDDEDEDEDDVDDDEDLEDDDEDLDDGDEDEDEELEDDEEDDEDEDEDDEELEDDDPKPLKVKSRA